MSEDRAANPHCDELVLHSPGKCEYCDEYPERQRDRIYTHVNFTGENNPEKQMCPAEKRRNLKTIERWPGNVVRQP